MSERTKDATACHPARSTAESNRTPTRTTRTPIRMPTSHTVTAVHRAATAMTPGTGSEPVSAVKPRGLGRPSLHPAATEPRRSQIVPFLCFCYLFCLPVFFPLSIKSKSHKITFRYISFVKLPGQPPSINSRDSSA